MVRIGGHMQAIYLQGPDGEWGFTPELHPVLSKYQAIQRPADT